MSPVAEFLLALFILNLGTAFGAGLYETRIVIPMWFRKSAESGYRVDTEAMQTVDTGRTFWAFVTTGPLTLLTLANLVVAWQSQSTGHDWWLAAALITLIERAGTFSFFIPTIIKLQKAEQLSPPTTSRLIRSWIWANYIRNGLTLLACLAALRALSF